jgi:hypothetical protein
MLRKPCSRGRDRLPGGQARRCRALTNLALQIAGQLPGGQREAAYRQLLRTLSDHIGEPEGASAAIAELLAGSGPSVA